MSVAVVSDWDADGVVSAAQILYSQSVLGVYPFRGRRDVLLVPSSVREVADAVGEVVRSGASHVFILDIAFSKYMDRALETLRSKDVKVFYIDHHISTAIHLDSIRPRVENIVLGKTSTAMLVYNHLKSVGVELSERLKAFVEAVTIIEKGGRQRVKEVHTKLIDIVASLSRKLVGSRDRELWNKVVRWLAQPLPTLSLPFASDITLFAKSSQEHLRELKAIASEVALSAARVLNVRFVDIRGRKYPYKSTAIATALHRLLKSPVVLLARNKRGCELLVIKSGGTLAYDMAMHLYRRGFAEDIMGHQTLVIMLLKPGVTPEKIVESIREFLFSGPAGI